MRTAGVAQFRPAATFATFCGVKPLHASSGAVERHRAAGQQPGLNSVLHSLERRLSDVVQNMIRDTDTSPAQPRTTPTLNADAAAAGGGRPGVGGAGASFV
ncbi:transposase [Spirillospora sp. NPDC047418]